MRRSAESASGLIRRNGWSFGTKASGVSPSIIVACRSASPRIADLPRLSDQRLLHDLIRSIFSSLLGEQTAKVEIRNVGQPGTAEGIASQIAELLVWRKLWRRHEKSRTRR